MSYLNSVTIVGFVGADPEQRQARNNGSKFTVLSVATQRSWKNSEDEWVSKVEWHRVASIWNLNLGSNRRASLTAKPVRYFWIARPGISAIDSHKPAYRYQSS